jgi:hypothetical protein
MLANSALQASAKTISQMYSYPSDFMADENSNYWKNVEQGEYMDSGYEFTEDNGT